MSRFNRTRPLKTHLALQISPGRMRTACGLEGVPPQGHTFSTQGGRHEGTVPGSVGRGVVAVNEPEFHHRNAPGGLCGGCEIKWRKDMPSTVVHTTDAMLNAGFTPRGFDAMVAEAAAERGLSGYDAEMFAMEAAEEYA